MSVRAAGIPFMSELSSPVILEVLPPSAALPVMAVTILSMWAALCAPESSSVHKPASEPSSVHKLDSEASPIHEFTPVPPEVAASAAEHPEEAASTAKPPEVSAFAAEPPEMVGPTHELVDYPVTATKAVHELTFCSVMTMES